MKKLLALVLALVMTLSLCTVTNAFTDDKSVNEDYAEAVAVLNGMGVFKGYEDGSFQPEGSITRAEVAAIIYRIYTADVKDKQAGLYAGYKNFSDVATSAWYAGYVGYCTNAAFIKGMGNGTFAPAANVTGYQALAMILRAMGYDQNGEFEGADWELHVAQIAQQLGILKNVKGESLRTAASRQLVAELLFKAIQCKTVSYTALLGYKDNKTSLATDNFSLKKTNASDDDVFGRPSTKWTYTTGDKKTVFKATPDKTYTVKVNGCDVLVDMGVETTDHDKYTFEYWVDGDEKTDVKLNHTNGSNCGAKDTKFGGQGTLTEVYDLGDDTFRVVEINTYLAKIGKTTKAKNTHEDEDSVKLFVYTSENKAPVEKIYTYDAGTESYTKDEYALVTIADGDVQSAVEIEAADTAKVNSFNTKKAITTVGGTAYDWAAKFFCGNPGHVGTKYNVYTDAYGNVIGLVAPEVDPEYTFLYQGIAVTGGWDSRYEAKIVDTDANVETVVVDEYNDEDPAWRDKKAEDVRLIVSYTVDDDEYSFEDVEGLVWAASVEKGSTRIRNAAGSVVAVADGETNYLVETSKGEFTAYTGYKNVPSIDTGKNGLVEVLVGEDGYAELVYIDAREATYEGTSQYAVILNNARKVGHGETEEETDFVTVNNVVIDGETTYVDVRASYVDEFLALNNLWIYHNNIKVNALVELTYDSEGLVIKAELVDDVQYGEVNKVASGEVIYFNEWGNNKGFFADEDSVLWHVDEDGNAEVFELDELEKGAILFFTTLEKDDETFEFVLWYENYDN